MAAIYPDSEKHFGQTVKWYQLIKVFLSCIYRNITDTSVGTNFTENTQKNNEEAEEETNRTEPNWEKTQ